MIDLHQITLVMVATRAHDLSKIAINDCLRQAAFGDVLIYTNDQARVQIPGARYFSVTDWDNKKDAGRFYYSAAAANVETPFGLFIEWDAGIFNPGKWRDDFLAYDYVGAPWNTGDDLKVGNGGFTLMSKRFGDFLCKETLRFPVTTDWDICRTHRRGIEAAGGFKWAPYEVAQDFAWELAPRSPNTFGYHGIFNWPDMIGHPETIQRVKLMVDDTYLCTKLAPLFKSAPWLVEAIGTAAFEKYLSAIPNNVRPARPFGAIQQPNRGMSLSHRRALLASMVRPGLKA